VVLAQGISSRERMEFTLQKAVELGVAEIFPLETRRSVVRLNAERAGRRVEHWQNVVSGACEQCGRNRIPPVHPVRDFADWLGMLERDSSPLRVMLSPRARLSLRELPAPSSVLLLIGPEGGLAPEEEELAGSCGFQAVCLGPRILRTETAALAAMSAMHALWGDF
jgi:16S rRNA (uracil1498-N3)-methyltransferase